MIPENLVTVQHDFKKLYEQEKDSSEKLCQRIAELESRNEELSLQYRDLSERNEASRRKFKAIEENLRHARAEIDDELEIARSIQVSLLPKALPEIINLKASAVYMPTGKVGGDLYDIVLTPRQKVAILIFDVSGHGVPAALIAAMAKMLFAHYIEKIESPSVIFKEVNEQICNFIQTEHYLTAFLGMLDPLHNRLVYSRAGHVKPILHRAANDTVEFLGGRGFFIGHSALRNMAEYSEEVIDLAPGDKVLFYTDGLTEGCNRDFEFYGTQRLAAAVQKHRTEPVEDFVTSILEDQTRFRSGMELHDDFTMLCIQAQESDWLFEESGFSREDSPSVLLASSYADIDRVCGMILRAMDENGYPDVEIKRMKVCIFEMLMNAVEHGNRRDSQKKVTVLYTVSSERMALSVMDEGLGFDYKNLPDPLSPENLRKNHGRGIFFVRKYMDSVTFNKTGNRILGVKHHRGGV